jgi:hypothetical protein
VSHRTGTLLLAALSAVVSLLLGEAGARLLLPRAGERPLLDAALGWSTAEYQRFDPAAEVAGSRRILFLGDSYLAGAGVSALEQRFPSVLESLLGEGHAVRVLATGGWGTDQQLLAMMQKGTPWKPDTVVLVFCPVNDLSNILSNQHPNPDPASAPMRKPYFVLDDSGALGLYTAGGELIAGAELLEAITDPPVFQSALLALLRYHVRSLIASRSDLVPAPDPRYGRFRVDPDFAARRHEILEQWRRLTWSPQFEVSSVSAYIHEDFETNAYQWRLLEAILSALKSEVTAGGARLVVMLLPAAFGPAPELLTGSAFERRFETPQGPFTFRSAEPGERLAAIAERLGLWFFDPSADFVRHVIRDGWPPERYYGPDEHFGDDAHRWLATRLHRYLGQLDALRPPDS